ncbi:GIY-YIG nuclease family protein [Sapientia aquatica]|uniref:GIY-YIG domain-containing protein n=1 Tax=Sapientia aquatica TaxID=1549640 RepID=A0A4R5VRE2_9BURK|nr:GIY-YIG nuclease family protein [Sapientia aquatica]TDK61202.1 hypothetical protein E2I14_17580 [Sapientia aquatica]
MRFKKSDQLFLYHIRDAATSGGIGYDGYVGITDNPKRRKREHFAALANGTHSNAKLQTAYNKSPASFQFWIATSGNKESIEARELRILVNVTDDSGDRDRCA